MSLLNNGPSGFTGPFNNLTTDDYWSGTEYSPDTSRAWGFFFGFGTGYQYVDPKWSVGTALAVHPGVVSAVPVPATLWLLGGGLVGLAGLRRKFKR